MAKIKKFLPVVTEIWVQTDTHTRLQSQNHLLDPPLLIGPVVNNDTYTTTYIIYKIQNIIISDHKSVAFRFKKYILSINSIWSMWDHVVAPLTKCTHRMHNRETSSKTTKLYMLQWCRKTTWVCETANCIRSSLFVRSHIMWECSSSVKWGHTKHN